MKKVLSIFTLLILSNCLLAELPIQQHSNTQNWLNDFSKDSTPDPRTFGLIQTPTRLTGASEHSVLMARLRQKSIIRFAFSKQTTLAPTKNYNFVNYANQIPRDLVPYADRFFGATTPEHFKIIEREIRQEIEQDIKDKRLLEEHPWQSFALIFITAPLEPFGVIAMIILWLYRRIRGLNKKKSITSNYAID